MGSAQGRLGTEDKAMNRSRRRKAGGRTRAHMQASNRAYLPSLLPCLTVQIGGGILLACVLLACGGSTNGPDKALEPVDLLPESGDIQGWHRVGPTQMAGSYDELYTYIDGAADRYVDHGFEAYAAQRYEGTSGFSVEISIYDQGDPLSARELYNDPLMVPTPHRALPDLGDEARVDESGLFDYSIEFWQGRFFVRVTVSDTSADALHTALLFATHLSERMF